MKLLIILGLLAVASGTRTERLDSARDAWRAGDWVQANTLLEELLGEDALVGIARAKVAFVQGVVLAEEREDSPVTEALAPFRMASAWAKPGQLRRDAIYNSAWVELNVAEQALVALKESMQPTPPGSVPPGSVPPPAVPPAVGSPVAGAQSAPVEPPSFEELLKTARSAYDVAKASFVERLRLDSIDEDTRANLEWIQRRLHELDELEQQQQEQEEQDGEDGEPSDENEEGEEQEDGEPSEDSEGDPSDEEKEKSDDEADPEDSDDVDPGESQEPEDQPEDEAGEEDQPEPGEEQQEGEEQPPQPQPGEPEERYLTKEEMQRLFDRLQTAEEEGERVRAALQRARRVPVDRDW